MARDLIKVLTFICIGININDANQNHLRCAILEDVFPQCECAPATQEKGYAFAIVDCSKKNFEEIPINSTFDQVLYKLVLKNNKITTLTENSFRGLKVEYLDLTGNSLISVDDNAFLSMKDNLKTLEMDGDGQSSPPINALKKLNVIQSLTLRNYNVPVLEQNQQLFLSFTYLKSLTLDRWNINHIEASAFLGLDRLESLILLNQKLENMPVDGLRDDPFNSLETLRISYTEITTVSYGVFSRLSKLKNLDLSSNKIEELEANCFQGVEDTLQNINLKNNNLRNGVDTLAGLSGMTALERIDFSFNTFQSIPKMPSLGVTKPLRLLLNDNDINQVLDYSFSGYETHLKDIDLRSNLIRAMNKESFHGVTNLNSIYLQNQRGDSDKPLQLPLSLSNSASTIQTLKLSGQKVDNGTLWTLVKDMTSLQTLDLNSAELEHIPDDIFIKATALESIDLNYNYLHTITQRSLAGARSLKRLDLEGNTIETFPKCLFYEFLSPSITLSLSQNPIKCDCEIKPLLEDIQKGRIVLEYQNNNVPTCQDSTSLLDIKPENLNCNPSIEESDCLEYYTTTSPKTVAPVTEPNQSELHVIIGDIGLNTIEASWSLTDETGLQKFRFHATTSSGVSEFDRKNIEKSIRTMVADGLQPNTVVTVCVTAYFSNGNTLLNCKINRTKSSSPPPDKDKLNDEESDSATTGIIVGCAVGGVALIGIVIAIVILLVCRKTPKKAPDNYRPPTQPRSFAKAELPSMSDDSRTFAKPKKNGKGPHSGNMQVVAISDGQTNPNHGHRVGRVNMMFKPEDGYEPMSNFKKQNGGSMYENDHGALPPTPGPDQDSRPPSYPRATGAYYNAGFNEDKYDEIEVEI